VNETNDNLAAVMAQQGIELPEPQVSLLDRYCTLLWDWNTKLNLTRHTDYEKFVTRDLVDSLAFAQFLEPDERILDVGTGGGVPGVGLAIVRPDLTVELCESVGKRARAVADIVSQLGLDVPMHAVRVEQLLEERRYNTLVSRAVARLAKLLDWFRPHWDRFDRLLTLKGPAWVDERAEARHLGFLHDLALRKLTSYPMPGTESESVLLQICPKDRLEEEKHCRLTDLSVPPLPGPKRTSKPAPKAKKGRPRR
jgi:16S rRNA (guanine527-N7)-methyltransferase